MNLAYLAILLMLVEYGITGYLVSVARVRFKVNAPAVSGHEEFERYIRVQQNTIEQLIFVIPSLWIFALTVSPLWAALLGFAFVAARAYYIYGYIKHPPSRHYGFMLGAYASGALLVGALIGVLKGLFA